MKLHNEYEYMGHSFCYVKRSLDNFKRKIHEKYKYIYLKNEYDENCINNYDSDGSDYSNYSDDSDDSNTLVCFNLTDQEIKYKQEKIDEMTRFIIHKDRVYKVETNTKNGKNYIYEIKLYEFMRSKNCIYYSFGEVDRSINLIYEGNYEDRKNCKDHKIYYAPYDFIIVDKPHEILERDNLYSK